MALQVKESSTKASPGVVRVAERSFLGISDSTAGKLPLLAVYAALTLLSTVQTCALLSFWGTMPGIERCLGVAAGLSNLLFAFLAFTTTALRVPPTHRASGLPPRIVAVLGSFLSLLLILMPTPTLPLPVLLLGLALVVTGCLLSFLTLSWLGQSFSIVPEARRLVTSGPYAIVRHPLYVCEQVAIIGCLIMHLSVPALILIAVQMTLQFRRMANEETVLRQAFPDYPAYAAAVPRLIPRFALLRRLKARPTSERLSPRHS